MTDEAVAQPPRRAVAQNKPDGERAGGGHLVAPATRVSLSSTARTHAATSHTGRRPIARAIDRVRATLGKLRSSVWAPLVVRVVAGGAITLGLAAVGTASLEHLPSGSTLQASALAERGVDWLAGTPSEPSSPSAPKHGGAGSSPAPSAPPPAASAAPLVPCPSASAQESAPQGVTADGKVILNTATASELTRLPGVGERRAEAIVELRERLKRFRKPTDLLRVRGIGVRGYKRMLPMIVLDPPAAPDKTTAKPDGQQAAKTPAAPAAP